MNDVWTAESGKPKQDETSRNIRDSFLVSAAVAQVTADELAHELTGPEKPSTSTKRVVFLLDLPRTFPEMSGRPALFQASVAATENLP